MIVHPWMVYRPAGVPDSSAAQGSGTSANWRDGGIPTTPDEVERRATAAVKEGLTNLFDGHESPNFAATVVARYGTVPRSELPQAGTEANRQRIRTVLGITPMMPRAEVIRRLQDGASRQWSPVDHADVVLMLAALVPPANRPSTLPQPGTEANRQRILSLLGITRRTTLDDARQKLIDGFAQGWHDVDASDALLMLVQLNASGTINRPPSTGSGSSGGTSTSTTSTTAVIVGAGVLAAVGGLGWWANRKYKFFGKKG